MFGKSLGENGDRKQCRWGDWRQRIKEGKKEER